MEELLIRRPCILVQDLERSLKIYRDRFGFQPTYQSPAGPDSYLYQVFDLPDTAQLTFVSCDTSTAQRALAIVEARNLSPAFFEPRARIALVIQVASVPDIIAELLPLDLHILPPNQFQTGSGLTFIEQGLQDFDGNRLVLYSCQSSQPDPKTE